jgi:thymidine kinase
MATAEYVTKVHAVCTHTGNLAQYSFRKSDDDNLVFLGQTGEYEPLSRAAYYHAMGMDITTPQKTGKRKDNKRKKSG